MERLTAAVVVCVVFFNRDAYEMLIVMSHVTTKARDLQNMNNLELSWHSKAEIDVDRDEGWSRWDDLLSSPPISNTRGAPKLHIISPSLFDHFAVIGANLHNFSAQKSRVEASQMQQAHFKLSDVIASAVQFHAEAIDKFTETESVVIQSAAV